ncbi:hypothetical protein CPA56_02860 [Bombella sp. TMW2.1889]|uniref:ABC-three component systems C-terminal domain-containing protein n=2 Tax=Bombella mellum TaxID=2039288 RepID=A0ABR5ZRH9_9PROT|nr:hypothetical protein [Bombella mellum]
MTEEDRNSIKNLIYLCSKHHEEIDKINPDKYSAENLRKMKEDHERRVDNACYSCVGFPELEAVTEYIINSRKTAMTDDTQNEFDKIRLSEKIELNHLTECDHDMIENALQRAYLVKRFIEERAQMDSDFPAMLKAGFREHYYALFLRGKRGHDLFEGMCGYVKRPFLDECGKQYAAQAVLAYLFEACDIFERR